MKSSILNINKTKQRHRANTPTCINIARYNKMSPAGIKIPDKMGRRQKLKTLCETRWASRSYSLFTFLSAFSVVCSSFEELEHGCDAKARSNLCPITQFDFIVCLVAVQSIVQPLVPISAILQTKDFDLIQAFVGSKTVIDLLQGMR